jgi:DNA-binding NarL/FixJ family response regulator
VIGECGRTDELLASVGQSRPDVLLLDQDLTEGRDVTLLRELLSHYPRLRVVVLLAGEPPDDYLGRAAAAGAAGFVLRQADPSLLVKAIRAVASGRPWIQRELTSRLIQDYVRVTTPVPTDMPTGLSPRQRELLVLLAQGLRNRDIAQQLGLSEKTVKAHLTAVFRKLGVSSRVGAACYAVSQGLCDQAMDGVKGRPTMAARTP